MGHRSVIQVWECNAGEVFEWCSHVLECRVGNEEGSVQQFPMQRRSYKKDQYCQLLLLPLQQSMVSANAAKFNVVSPLPPVWDFCI